MDDSSKIGLENSDPEYIRQKALKKWANVREQQMLEAGPNAGIWTYISQSLEGIPSALKMFNAERQDKGWNLNEGDAYEKHRKDIYNKIYKARSQGQEPNPEDMIQWTDMLNGINGYQSHKYLDR